MNLRKEKLLILTHNQLGVFTAANKICEHLNASFEITVVCWDYHLPRKKMEGIEVRYISREGNVLKRNVRLFAEFIKCLNEDVDYVYVKYQKGISLVNLLTRKKMLLDIRTLSVHHSKTIRRIEDFILKMECKLFKYKSILSHDIAKKMGMKNYFYFPLGADSTIDPAKKVNKFSLLYVGTLQGRNLDRFLRGFELFLKEKRILTGVSLDIIGDGPELYGLMEFVDGNLLLADKVTLHGRMAHHDLKPFFERCLIGVSYIPITDWYDLQPPTKTYEYLLSRLIVLGTATTAHNQLKDDSNVFLIGDCEESIRDGLVELWETYVKDELKFNPNDYREYTWDYIIKKKFVPILKWLKNNPSY